MSKKVLILSSSPRKGGNSDLLCDEFMRGAKESGHDVEKIFIAQKKINYCMGCGVCNSTSKCVQHDDMAEILDKMVSADAIVLATPIYFYSMDDQESMDSKNGIARLNKAVSNVYFVKIKDKEVVIENQKVKSATLLYIKDHQITKEYKGLKQLKDHSAEILQMSW